MRHAARVLRVVFDAFALGTPAGRGGIGTYQRRLLDGLARREDVVVHVLAHDDVTLPAGVVRHRLRRLAPGRFQQLEHDLALPCALRRTAGDVVHNAAPYGPRRPTGAPFVQTLFDVIPLRYDTQSMAPSRKRFAAGARAYRSATAVVAISRHAADEGIHELGLDPDRVHVVALAPDTHFRPPTDGELAGEPVAVDPYLLLVGQFDERKGFAEAFDVVGRLAARGFPHRLRVAGNLPAWVRPAVDSLRSHAPRPDRIDLLGFVEDLRPLYWGAAATLVTSRYEGFGLPALEAMACGSPVIAFDNSALSEVIGDGGVLVPDGDVAGVVDAVANVLSNDEARRALVVAGPRRARRFSESAFIDGHVAVYEQAARDGRRPRH